MEQELSQKKRESKPESSTEERASFASLAMQKEANKTSREALRKVKEQLNDDRVAFILGVAAAILSFVFLQLSFSKADYAVTFLSLPFFTFLILLGGGAFLIGFGLIRFFLHKKRIKELDRE